MKQVSIPDAGYEDISQCHNIHVIFFASTLLALYLFTLIPASFLFSSKLFKSLSNLLIMVYKKQISLVNELNFHSFLSLFVFILGHCLGKCPNNLYINLY